MEADAAAVNGSQKAKFKENEKVFAYHLNLIYEAKVIWQVHTQKYILTSRARSWSLNGEQKPMQQQRQSSKNHSTLSIIKDGKIGKENFPLFW